VKMRVVTFLWLCIAGTLFATGSGQHQESTNGLVPLHSTRSDFENRFGRSTDSCQCMFRTEKETIAVDYASAPCKGRLYGWNVPKDTVLAFTNRPKVPFPVSEINLNADRFIRTHSQDENVTIYYTDTVSGTKYAVQENKVIFIRHVPSSRDNDLRCPGFPAYDGGIAEYTTYDTFSTENDVETSARLDNFAVQLSQGSSLKGYIVAYAGAIAKKDEGTKMAEWARRYLIEKRSVPPNRVSAVDGGFRERPGYDLFLLPVTMRPPTPTPTVASNEVRIVR